MEIKISLDIGQESTKMCYAYKTANAVFCMPLLFDGLESYPSIAFYNEENDEWIFGYNALYGANKSQKPIISIKELINNIDDDSFLSSNTFENKSCNFKFQTKSGNVSMLLDKFFEHLIKQKLPKALHSLKINSQENRLELIFAFESQASDKSKQRLKMMLEKQGMKVSSIAQPIAAAVCCLDEGASIGGDNLVVDMGVSQSSMVLFDTRKFSNFGQVNFDFVDNIAFGGAHFDELIYNYITSISTSREDLNYFQQYVLYEDIKTAKKILCEGKKNVIIEYQSYAIENIVLTNEKFGEISQNLIKKYAEAIINYTKQIGNINCIILTGGTSKNIYLTQQIEKQLKAYNKETNIEIIKAGELGVAKGAAIFATGAYDLSSISTKCYGIECFANGINGMSVLVGKNAKLPFTYTTSFTTQTSAKSVEICIRSCDMPAKINEHIKQLNKTNIVLCDKLYFKSLTSAKSKVDITIDIDKNGIGVVTAKGQRIGEVITSKFRTIQ